MRARDCGCSLPYQPDAKLRSCLTLTAAAYQRCGAASVNPDARMQTCSTTGGSRQRHGVCTDSA